MSSDAQSTTIWSRPWSGPAKTFAWTGLLALGLFTVLTGIRLYLGESPRSPGVLGLGVGSLLLAGLLALATSFVRWLCHWRNLRRFLTAAVGLLLLLVAVYGEENWRGRHAWQAHARGIEARGEHFSLTELAPPAVSEEKNMALAPLLKPLLDYSHGPTGIIWGDTNGLARIDSMRADQPPQREANAHLVLGKLEKGTFADASAWALFYRGNTNYPQAGPEAKPAEVVLTALSRFTPELKELQEAAARTEARFPIHYADEPNWNILLPHLSRIKALTLLTQVRATATLEEGRGHEAFDDLRLGLRLSESIRQEPLLIDHLVRLATLGMDLQTVREGLRRHAWSGEGLSGIQVALQKINLLAEYKRAMSGERACETRGLDFLRRQGLHSEEMSYLGSDEGAASTAPSFSLVPSGLFYQNMLTISRFFETYTLPAADEQARRISPVLAEQGTQALEAMRRGPYTLIAKLLLPALQKAVQKSGRMQTYVDATRVGCALEAYRLANGKLPDSLETLAPRFLASLPGDLIDGKPLRYRQTAEGGYLIYSIGWNQKDDGGEIAWSKGKDPSVDASQGDWVWQMAEK